MSRTAPAQSTSPALPRAAYSAAEVANALGISTRHVYRLIESGELPAKRIGRRVVILRAAFDAYAAA